MLTSNFNSWDKGVFSVIGKPGGPSTQDFIKPKHFYLRDDEAVAKFDVSNTNRACQEKARYSLKKMTN